MKKALTVYLLTFSIIHASTADDYIHSGVRGDSSNGMCETCSLTSHPDDLILYFGEESAYNTSIKRRSESCYDACRRNPTQEAKNREKDIATGSKRSCSCDMGQQYKLTCTYCRSLSSNKNLAAPQDSAPKKLVGQCKHSDIPHIGFWGGDGKAEYGYRTTPIIKCQDPEGNFYNAKMEY